MSSKISPHDKFFRSAMQNLPVALEFFQHYLPAPLCKGLNLDTIKLQNSTYIDKDLRETVSDLVCFLLVILSTLNNLFKGLQNYLNQYEVKP
ncbi:MAG: putative transposase YdaD [Phenylobacterium sp.]|jgi:predicted transposase YdaD